MTDEKDDHAEPSPRHRKIIHIDMDAFYASVEQRDNLRSNPPYTPNSYGDHVRDVTKRLLTVDLAGKYPTIDHLTCTQARKLFATSLDKKDNDPHYVEVKNALMNEMPTVYRTRLVTVGGRRRSMCAQLPEPEH